LRARRWAGQRLRDAGRLDQQVVKAARAGQAAHLDQQVLTQGAADAVIAHLDQALLGAAEGRPTAAHQLHVNVDLTHIVDDDRHAQPLTVGEHMVEQGGLPRAEEAGEHRHGEQPGWGKDLCHN
jgi:hypothetical protein